MSPYALALGRRFTVDTGWSPAEIEHELDHAPEVACGNGRGWWAIRRTSGRFRLLRQGAPQRVVASGRWCATPEGSRVAVTLRLSWAGAVVFFAALPLVSVLALAVVLASLLRREPGVLFVWIVPLSFWPRLLREFAVEARDAESLLRRVFPPPAPPSVGPFR